MSFSGASAADLTDILRQPGRFVVNPSDLSAAFPHGGTYLGSVRNGCAIEFPMPFVPLVHFSEAGTRPYGDFFRGWGEILIFAEIRQWNNDNLQLLFPGMTVVKSSGERAIQIPGALAVGPVSGQEVTLLYVPFDTTGEDRTVLMRHVQPGLEAMTMELALLSETTLPVTFRMRDDPSPSVAAESRLVIGKLSDLEL